MKRLKGVVKAFLFSLCLISGLFGGSNLGVNAEEQTSTEVTRIEWLKALTEAFEMQVDESNYPDNYYSDIDASSEDYYEVMLATEFGLIDVEAGDALRPNDVATREFAAHTLNLCMGYFMEEGTEYTFSEVETVKYPEDIQIAVDKGWLELSGNDFLPEQGITVAEKDKMIAAAESVVASTVIDSAYAGQFELVEGVLVIPEETEILLTNENELTMSNCLVEIEEGDIFVVFSDGFPIARKALTVTKEENTTVVTVESVDLEEAFVDIDVQGNIDADLTQVQTVDDEVQLAYIVGGTEEQAYEDGVTFYSLEEVGGQEVTAVIATKTIETTDQMRSTYGLKPEENISIKCKITKVSADYDVSLLKQKAYLNVSGTVTFSANISSGDIPLGFEDSLVRVPIGVIGYFKPQLEAGLNGTISLSMKSKVSVGVQWTAKDGVRLNSDFKKEAFTIQTQIEGKIGVKVAIGVDVGFLNAELYAKAGGKASIKVVTYTDNKYPPECKHVTAHLYAVVGGKVTFKLVIFKAEIALEKELMNEENSPVKIALHYENGEAVSECTRDAMSEEEEGGDSGSSGTGSGSSSTGSTKQYKYYTPIDSQYTYSGANTGIASTGETYTIFEYSLNDNNQATITKYNGNVSALNIPETIDGYTVVGIGSKVFQNNSRLMLVNIPDTVTEIGTYAFAGCSNLADVTLSSSLTTLGSSSFYNCDELTSIEIPGAVTEIENSAFKSCSNLVSVVFSETSELINIADMAFAYCEMLEQIDIPDGVTKIGAGSFGNCTKLSSVDLPISLNTIGAHAFYNCDNLASIEIPKNLKETYDAYIYEFAYDYQYGPFYGCNGLKSIVFEEGATLVPNGLFANCPGIEIIIMPNTITAINNYAFMNCDSLKEVTFSENLVDIADMAFAYCEKLEQVDIPDGVTKIGAGSFGNCTKLSSVDLPISLNTIGAHAFYNCDNLASIEIPKNLKETYDAYIYEFAYDYQYGPFYGCDGLKEITFEEGVTKIPNGLFANCSGVENIVIPETVTQINSNAFLNCVNMENITLSNSITAINNYAFYGCKNLTSVDLPNSLSSLGYFAFGNCDGLTCIEIPKNLASVGVTDVWLGGGPNYRDAGPFTYCDNLKEVSFEEGTENIVANLFTWCVGVEKVTMPNTVSQIGSSAFMNCYNMEEVLIGNSVTAIYGSAFKNCSSLLNVTIPDSVTEMGTYVFAGCSSLQSAKLPNIRKNVTEGTFQNCTALTTIELPESVIAIAKNAFQNSGLTTITIPQNVGTIGDYAFNNCDSLQAISIPDSVTTLGTYCFADCEMLSDVQLGSDVASVSYIGPYAFNNCDSLQAISIPDSVTTLGTYCFANCEKLTDIHLGAGLTQIMAYTFNLCPSIQKIVLPYRISTVAANAFTNCTGLTEITIPRATSSIANNTFSYPTKMTVYGIAGTYAEEWANSVGATFVNQEIPATEVTLSETALTINNGKTANLILSVTPEDFTDAIAWKSSNEAIATVSDTGVVTAKGIGSATIRVTVGNLSASCKVTVVQPVTSITLNKTSLTLEAEETYSLSATVRPSDANDKTVTWSSSNETVATVSEDGVVTALKKGTAVITVTANDGSNVSKSCTVTVTNTCYHCETIEELESSHNYENDCSDVWTYTLQGTTQIAVTFDERTEVEEAFDYLYLYDAEGNEVGEYTGTELAGQTILITGDTVKVKLVSDSSGNAWGFKVALVEARCEHTFAEEWSSDEEYHWHAATCGHEEEIIDKEEHIAGDWIVDREAGNRYKECTVCATILETGELVSATEIALSETELTINNGETANLILSVIPEDFSDVIVWESSDEAVAIVSDTGVVTAKSVGSATICVTVGNLSASCEVTVVQPVTSITLDRESLSLEAEEIYALSATISPSDAGDKTVTWSSSDETVATVSEDGVVTALQKGTAVITVTANDGSDISESCTVTVTNTCYQCESIEDLDSSHNYENDCNDVWIYILQGAEQIAVTFDERTEVEERYDYLYLYDAEGNEVGRYTGTELAGQTIIITGDTVKVKLSSDGSVSKWGFKVTQVEEYCEHTFDSEWSSDEKYHWHAATCGHDQEIKDKEEHISSEWIIDKEATAGENGSKHKECTVCATILETEEILGSFEEEVSDVESFVTRMYEQCLSRDPDQAGLDGWAGQLENGNMNGAQIAEQFVFSNEMLSKNLSDEEFVNVLYRAMMGREADAAGRTGWVNELSNGYMTRSEVTKAFVESVEFTEICTSYGITRGTYDASMAPIEHFVTRFYTLCLERKPDQAGLYGWVNNLKNQYMNGAQIADAFIFSDEFVNKNVSDEKYIELLYNTLLGRPSDENGKAGWLGELQNGYMTRRDMMKAFIESTEFTGICETYGITRGSL